MHYFFLTSNISKDFSFQKGESRLNKPEAKVTNNPYYCQGWFYWINDSFLVMN